MRTAFCPVAAATALLLVQSGAAAAQDQKVYDVLLKTLSNPFWGAMEEGVQLAAADVLDGKEVETFIYVPTVVLTQEVLEDGTEPLLEYVR